MTTETLTSQACDHCGAPLDAQQRYCIECGSSRHHVDDPLARFMARRRVRAAAPPVPVAMPARRPERIWIAVALALVPVAAALGVLVGHRGGGDGAVLAALRAQKAPVVQVGQASGSAGASGTGGAAAAAAAKGATPTSTFALQKGFVVALQTLPAGTAPAAVTRAERAARAKGAPRVGLIVAKDFRLSPAAKGAYVVYSGAYRSRSAAAAGLAKLKRRFRAARVVAVSAPAAARTSSGAVPLATHATAQQKAAGRKAVQEIQSRKGKSYVEQQRHLPDTIVVP